MRDRGELSRAVHGGRHAARQPGRVSSRGLQPRPSEAECRVFRCRAPSRFALAIPQHPACLIARDRPPTQSERPLCGLAVDSPPPARSRHEAARREKPVPGGGGLGRPPLRSGIGQDARQGARPAGPSSDLPLVTRLAISLADKAALSALALVRPALGCLGGSLYITKLCKPGTGFSVNTLEPAAPAAPSKGAPPWRDAPASSTLRLASWCSGCGRQGRPPLLRAKPRDSPRGIRPRSPPAAAICPACLTSGSSMASGRLRSPPARGVCVSLLLGVLK